MCLEVKEATQTHDISLERPGCPLEHNRTYWVAQISKKDIAPKQTSIKQDINE